MRQGLLRHVILGLFCVQLSQLSAQDSYVGTDLTIDTIRGAQSGYPGDNTFIELHLGVSGAWGENIRIYRPSEYLDSRRIGAMVSVGKFFTPAFGLRGTFGILQQCGRAEKEPREVYPEYYGDGFYNFSNINGFVDVLIDMHHVLFPYKEKRKFHFIPLFGIGFNSTFGFDKEKTDRFAAAPAPYKVDTQGRTYLALRAGLMLTYRLSEKLDISFESHMDATDDRYNGVNDDNIYDGYLVHMLGLKYFFHRGFSKYQREMTDASEVEYMNERLNTARRELAEAEQTDTVVHVTQEQILEMTVSFSSDKFNITDVQRPNVEAVANYIKARPDVDVVICGFADAQTAYPAYNMRLSKRRVMAVYNMLTQQFGVDPKRLSIDYKGDTVQPYYIKNRWNRVVVFKLTPHNKYKTE